jgi:membrane dipeptidase
LYSPLSDIRRKFLAIPIADLHCDTALGLAAGRRLDDPSLQVNLPAMAEAGVGLQVFACYVPPAVPEGRRFEFASRLLDGLEKEMAAFSQDISVCRTSQDVLDARTAGRFAAILAVENGDVLENDLGNLERLYARGVRLMTLVHARSNAWVVSSADREPAFDGLTRFGEEVVAAMNNLGMIVDVSHAHDSAVRKVLSLSCGPVVASHSCSRTLCPMPRNLSDDLARGIAAGGGLVGVNIYPGFLDARYRKESERAGDLFERLGREEEKAGADPAAYFALLRDLAVQFGRAMERYRVPLDRYLEHVYHLINVAGEEHVAFGSDFDGVPDLPEGIADCRGLRTAMERLSDAEMPRKTLEKVSWMNFLRVFRDVCG